MEESPTKKQPDFLNKSQILLSSYDDISLTEIKSIQKILKNDGYSNTSLLEEIPTKTNFRGKYDTKFIRLLSGLSKDHNWFIVPIFYFCPPDRNIKLGHHSELVDLITFFPKLIFVTGLFYFENSQTLNQIRVIPIQNHFK